MDGFPINELCWRVFSLFLSSFLISRPPYRLLFDNETSFKSRHKTETTDASNHIPSRSHSLYFTFFHTSRSALSYNPSIRSPSPAPLRSPLSIRSSAHVIKTAFLGSYSSRRAPSLPSRSIKNLSPLFLLYRVRFVLTPSLGTRVRMEQLSTRTTTCLPTSLAHYLSVSPPLLSSTFQSLSLYHN
jgi:hypothetical protein